MVEDCDVGDVFVHGALSTSRRVVLDIYYTRHSALVFFVDEAKLLVTGLTARAKLVSRPPMRSAYLKGTIVSGHQHCA